jgi:hypothetical protein
LAFAQVFLHFIQNFVDFGFFFVFFHDSFC